MIRQPCILQPLTGSWLISQLPAGNPTRKTLRNCASQGIGRPTRCCCWKRYSTAWLLCRTAVKYGPSVATAVDSIAEGKEQAEDK